jgi:hypothetical protein
VIEGTCCDVAASVRVLRLRIVVGFVWFVVGLILLSNYTWSHYPPPTYEGHEWTQLGRDLLFCLDGNLHSSGAVMLASGSRTPTAFHDCERSR